MPETENVRKVFMFDYLQKKKRVVNKDLLKEVKDKPCVVCGIVPSEGHHVKSRGAGGGDVAGNLLSLCRLHHTEIHKIGSKTFIKKYWGAKDEPLF